MSQIDDKYAALKNDGFDLGPALGPEEDAGYGGRLRRYRDAHIYYHAVMGDQAHEVHGGILATYLAQGGPGPHPATGRRHLGFPLSDEIDYELATGSGARQSQFEWGSIYWDHGRGVAVYGDVYKRLSQLTRGVGFPLTSNVSVAGGEAVYFERGCLWVTRAVPGGVLLSVIEPPLLGQCAILALEDPDPLRFARLVKYVDVSDPLYAALNQWRPTVFADIWNNCLSLRSVDPPGVRRSVLPLAAIRVSRPSATTVGVVLDLSAGARPLADRKLYDLMLTAPQSTAAIVSSHCFYAARKWDTFGILHVTDMHVSRRNEEYGDRLFALGLQPAGSDYANFQHGVRAFLTYANLLHAKGLADVIVATGDLVDYVSESGDRAGSGGNFVFFERLILGTAGSEELRLPIYTVFGNHDYRLRPYELLFEVDIPGDNLNVSEHSSHNLTPDEAKALQGGDVITVSKERAIDMVAVDPNIARGTQYSYYLSRINRDRNYVVKLGAHQIVMLDTGPDVGVPKGSDAGDLLTMFWKSLTGSFTEDEVQARQGAPNQAGVGIGGGFDLVPAAIFNGGEGLIIIGMHAPPFSPPGGEYPYYLRETQHPAADPWQIPEFLRRRKGDSRGWINTGTPHFKTGAVADGLDYGIARSKSEEFARMIAGGGVPRPADLVLCGHQHDRTEFRLHWDTALNQVQYFTDFYTENPDAYYATVNNFADGGIPAGHPLHLKVRADAPPQGKVTGFTDHRDDPPQLRAVVEVPPYADPLNSAADPREWWRTHRPLVMQTGALGPMSPRQRFDPRWRVTINQPLPGGTWSRRVYTVESVQRPTVPDGQRPFTTIEALGPQQPDVTFQGFRLIQVRQNTIARIRYVTLAELRRRGFEMPWEREVWGGLTPVPGGPLQTGTTITGTTVE